MLRAEGARDHRHALQPRRERKLTQHAHLERDGLQSNAERKQREHSASNGKANFLYKGGGPAPFPVFLGNILRHFTEIHLSVCLSGRKMASMMAPKHQKPSAPPICSHNNKPHQRCTTATFGSDRVSSGARRLARKRRTSWRPRLVPPTPEKTQQPPGVKTGNSVSGVSAPNRIPGIMAFQQIYPGHSVPPRVRTWNSSGWCQCCTQPLGSKDSRFILHVACHLVSELGTLVSGLRTSWIKLHRVKFIRAVFVVIFIAVNRTSPLTRLQCLAAISQGER